MVQRQPEKGRSSSKGEVSVMLADIDADGVTLLARASVRQADASTRRDQMQSIQIRHKSSLIVDTCKERTREQRKLAVSVCHRRKREKVGVVQFRRQIAVAPCRGPFPPDRSDVPAHRLLPLLLLLGRLRLLPPAFDDLAPGNGRSRFVSPAGVGPDLLDGGDGVEVLGLPLEKV